MSVSYFASHALAVRLARNVSLQKVTASVATVYIYIYISTRCARRDSFFLNTRLLFDPSPNLYLDQQEGDGYDREG